VAFILEKIENDYAGFKDKVKDNEFREFVSGSLKQNDPDTFRLLSKITSYFKDQHLQVFEVNAKSVDIDSTSCNHNLKEIRKYLSDTKKIKSKYEGYWLNSYNSSVIAIVKQKNSKINYNAYLIEYRNGGILPGCLIATLSFKDKGKFFTEYSMPGVSRYFFVSEFKSDTELVTDATKWRRLMKYHYRLLPSLLPSNETISGTLIDSNNYLFTIPDFSESNITIVDSIVKADFLKICHAKNLIIDIRNNFGGTVRCYAPLIPFVYTQPIVSVSGYHLASDDFIKHKEENIEEYSKEVSIDSALLTDMKNDVRKFKVQRGSLIYEAGDTVRCDSIMHRPLNVAIITNYACASAAEMMLLDFKQSSKVKIFGEHTAGAVDYLNIFPMESPSKKYVLYIASAKRYIPVGQAKLDATGISPDVDLSKSNKDWVKSVRDYYGNK
jgi:hypothetical protein